MIEMLITLSPAKTLDFTSRSATSNFTQPRMLNSSSLLNTRLRELGEDQLSALMKISDSRRQAQHRQKKL